MFKTKNLRTRSRMTTTGAQRRWFVRPQVQALEDRLAPSAGALDPTFSGDGKFTFDLGAASDFGRATALQADGRILIAGTTNVGGFNGAFSVARYTTAGVLDTTFDTDGVALIDFGFSTDDARALAIQPDGKIVVAGSVGSSSARNFGIARLNTDGTLDTTFNLTGKANIDLGTTGDEAFGVALQTDGKIVVVGANSSFGDFAALRLNANGSKDTTFDGDGIATINVSASSDRAYGVVIQSDGKIVLGGTSNNLSSGGLNFSAVRLNTNGSLDTTFDTDGKVDYDFSTTTDYGTGIALQTDGKILLGGFASVGGVNDFAVMRLNSNGALDTTFDTDGKANYDFGGSRDVGTSIAVRTDGRIVLGGFRMVGDVASFATVRILSTGALDTSFDSDGLASYDVGPGNDAAYGLAVLADNRVVLAGGQGGNTLFVVSTIDGDLGLLRQFDNTAIISITTAGALDTTFSGDAKATHSAGLSDDYGRGVAIQADGKIVVVTGSSGLTSMMGVARLNTDGTPDATFDADGFMAFDMQLSSNGANAVAVQGDGKIVVGGSSYVGSFADFAVARLNADGTFDTTFSSDGKTTFDLDNDDANGDADLINAMAIQTDGKIVAAGTTRIGTLPFFAAARFTTDGNPDPSYNIGGFTAYHPGGVSASDVVNAMAIQTDGKMVLAGSTQSSTFVNKFAVVRTNDDGSLDTTFDGDGQATYAVGNFNSDTAYAVAVQPDGKTLVAGIAFFTGGTGNDMAVIRLNIDGTLDSTFSGDGKANIHIGPTDSARTIRLLSDGKILLGGYTDLNGTNDFALVRLNSDGSLDTTFDGDGIGVYPIGNDHDEGFAVALQSNGSIVLAGRSFNTAENDVAVIRVLGNNPPTVAGVVINAGAVGPQRSRVTSVTVDFDSIVSLPLTPASAFELKRKNDGMVVGLSATVTSDTTTHVTLTFTSGAVDNTSLADGRYNLTVLAGQVSGPGGTLDGDGNGVGGDNYTLIGDPATNKLFRLFGDSDGDGTVATNDFIAFRLALGGTSSTFDFDNDGAVAASDFIQFRLRFGGSI